MRVDTAQNQTTNTTQIQSEERAKPKATVIKPDTKSNGFNNRKMLLIAGGVAITVTALLILRNHSAVPTAEASKQAERAANLQKSCIVAIQKESFVGTGEQIAKCGLQMVANDKDIEIKCDPQFVQETTEKYGLKNNVICDPTVKNNFNGSVIISARPSGGRFGGFGQVHIKAEHVSPYLETMLSLGNMDFTLSLNQDRVKKWEDDFQDFFRTITNATERGV
jgi:hypothetical protein